MIGLYYRFSEELEFKQEKPQAPGTQDSRQDAAVLYLDSGVWRDGAGKACDVLDSTTRIG